MASTKSKKSAKKSSKKGAKKPSGDLVKSIENLLKKHQFEGSVTLAASAASPCPKGSSLKPVTRQTPSGKTVTKLECVKDKK